MLETKEATLEPWRRLKAVTGPAEYGLGGKICETTLLLPKSWWRARRSSTTLGSSCGIGPTRAGCLRSRRSLTLVIAGFFRQPTDLATTILLIRRCF